MSANTGNAPAWLFSFLDLAFLILIALLHSTSREGDPASGLASIELPEIQRSSTAPLKTSSTMQWQVRIHPRRLPEDSAAFSVVASEPGQANAELGPGPGKQARVASLELRRLLERLRDQAAAKPLLAPHRDSRSEDFLIALGFVQEVWPETHIAAVRPQVTTPSVSAAPQSTGLP